MSDWMVKRETLLLEFCRSVSDNLNITLSVEEASTIFSGKEDLLDSIMKFYPDDDIIHGFCTDDSDELYDMFAQYLGYPYFPRFGSSVEYKVEFYRNLYLTFPADTVISTT